MRRLRQQVELDISRPIAAKNGEERTESVSVAEQEREFNKAVAPSSPISTLLSSARQPLIVANSLPSSQPLLRQATTAALAEQQKKQKADIQAANKKYIDNLKESNADEEKLADQKLRIVSGMVNNDEKNKGKSKAVDENNEVKSKKTSKSSCFVEMHQNLHNAFLSKKEARRFELPEEYKNVNVESASKVFIVSWLDYCNKYGMGYALTDGTVGVYFNDSTSMVLSPVKSRLDYIASKGKSSMAIRKNYTVDSEENALPKELESKMMILRHFEDYMLERLYGSRTYTFVDEQRRKGMTFVQRYYRMKNVIVFKLSNDVVQFNFYDHTKMILSLGGCLISYIDKDYALSRWTLDEIFQQDDDKEDKKRMEGILVKLKYCRDVFATTSGAKV